MRAYIYILLSPRNPHFPSESLIEAKVRKNVIAFINSWYTVMMLTRKLIRETDDLKVLYNDWPYGVEEDIIHLVVWTKFELEDDPSTDDLTPQARKEIDDWVEETFRSRMPAEKVL